MNHRSMKPSFKQVVIVQKKQNTNVIQTVSQSKENYIANGQLDDSYKTPRNDSLPSAKQENYDFKNLVINNYVQGYSNSQEIFQNEQTNKNELFAQQTLKINSYNYEKQKFFLSAFVDNGVRRAGVHNEVPFAATLNHDTTMTYNIENKNENAKDKANDSTCLHPMSINDDGTISNENRQNNTTNECENYSSNENQK